MSMTYSPFERNHMDYLKSIISTNCHIIISYYIVKANYMALGRYQSITNIVPPSSNMITQGIIFLKTIKGNCYDRLVSINIIPLSLSYRRFINNKKEAWPISRKRIRCTIREWRENSYIIYKRRRETSMCLCLQIC